MKHWCSAPDRAFVTLAAATWICAQATGLQDGPDGGEFDVILVSAATAQTPGALKAQLAPSGRLLIPLGHPDGVQWLTKLTRGPDSHFVEKRIEEVRFVPLISG
ncbi:hypothetical protein I3J27_30175 [Bradyrhizobium xenonodulans]|uniref:Protein-L-isoaspartate O-methyltransferase n=1 Tax=Bradyrhizobium xenonodulans TaxID=2736875 RepID=A0ABY7MFR4_9BRAD|nr:hypothetical protein [Bradyrhizobium xenonodulans]WBL77258.1 hypothetical protein I3J27_30175 [Bradyrhizobium xenonodulans]